MKAVTFHGIGDIRLESVRDPRIEAPTDAIVKLTSSAICGTDLHFVRGTMGGMEKGTILGHEGVGIIVETGKAVRNFKVGDRVVIPSTICCGYCSYCRAGYQAQCDNANPNGKRAGTAFYGGPKESGPFHGLQAELARIPLAASSLVKLPDEVPDDEAIMLSDIFPTGFFAADLAGIHPGDTVVVFGCGPVGQFAIASARLMDAGRIFAVDTDRSRLAEAQRQGAEVIDFNQDDPVDAILELTGGIGADRAIDAVGLDAYRAEKGPAARKAKSESAHFKQELDEMFAASGKRPGNEWHPGNAPTQVILWAVDALAKAGTLSIVGLYPTAEVFFPLGNAMNKNIDIRMGNCNHRRYVPELLERVRSGVIKPSEILTQRQPFASVIEAYQAFDAHQPGGRKVKLELAA